MAYLPTDPTQEEDKDKQGAAPEGGAGPVLGAPGAAPIQGAGTGQAAGTSQGANKPSRSGSFTNLMSYVNANKGNDAAMAGSIRGNVQTSADSANQAGSTFTNTAKEAIGRGTVQQDAGVQEGVRSLGRTAQPAAAKPVDQTAFNTQYNAEYKGPNDARDVSGFADTQAAHNKVAGYGQLASGDMSDRGALLTDVYGAGGKQYKAGERKLDSFILGAGEQGQQAMQDIANTYSGYGDKFRGIMDTIGYRQGADGTGAATGMVGEGVNTTKATRDAMRGVVGEAETGLRGYFDPLSTEAASKSQAENARYDAITSGNAEALAAAGYSPEAVAFLAQQDPGIYSKLAARGTGFALGDLSDDAVEGNYSGLRGLLSGAGGTSALPAYDFTNKGASGTAVDDKILAAINDGGDDWMNVRNAMDAANRRYDESWQLAQQDPSAYLRKYGLMSNDDLAAAQQAGVDLKSMLTKTGPATMGMFGNAATRGKLDALYDALGWDKTEIAHASQPFQGINFNSSGAQQAIANWKAAEQARMADQVASAQPAPVAAPAPVKSSRGGRVVGGAGDASFEAGRGGGRMGGGKAKDDDDKKPTGSVRSDRRSKTDIREVKYSEIEKLLKGGC